MPRHDSSMPIQLPDDAAEWARYKLSEQAKRLLNDAASARLRGTRNVVARPAETHIAEALHRAALVLTAAIKEINP